MSLQVSGGQSGFRVTASSTWNQHFSNLDVNRRPYSSNKIKALWDLKVGAKVSAQHVFRLFTTDVAAPLSAQTRTYIFDIMVSFYVQDTLQKSYRAFFTP